MGESEDKYTDMTQVRVCLLHRHKIQSESKENNEQCPHFSFEPVCLVTHHQRATIYLCFWLHSVLIYHWNIICTPLCRISLFCVCARKQLGRDKINVHLKMWSSHGTRSGISPSVDSVIRTRSERFDHVVAEYWSLYEITWLYVFVTWALIIHKHTPRANYHIMLVFLVLVFYVFSNKGC